MKIDLEENFKKKLKEYISDYYILNPVSQPVLETFKEENPDKKVIMVLYTGRVDSTYCLLKELEKGNLVIPVYNRLNCECEIDKQYLIEYTLIHNINLLRAVFSNLEPLQLNVSSQVHLFSSFTFYQQVYNVISIFTLGENILKHVDEVVMGIIMSDNSVSYISELKTLFNNSIKMIPNVEEPLKISLKFPLVKTTKDIVQSRLKSLIEKHKVDLKLISCENPEIIKQLSEGNLEIEIKPCRKCNSCVCNEHSEIVLKPVKMIAKIKHK